MGAHPRPLVAGPVAAQRLEGGEPAAARPALERAAVLGLQLHPLVLAALGDHPARSCRRRQCQ
jgi:hypothetical protein